MCIKEHMRCAICAENGCDHTLDGCNHSFHAHCIIAWFRTGNNTCPLCRSSGSDIFQTPTCLLDRARQLRAYSKRRDAPPALLTQITLWRRDEMARAKAKNDLIVHRKSNKAVLDEMKKLERAYRRATLHLRRRRLKVGAFTHSKVLVPLVTYECSDGSDSDD